MTVVKRFIEANQHLKRRDPDCWSGSTFGEALLWAADIHAEHLAVKQGDRSLTFVELAERSLAFARGLMAAGVKPGEKVGLWMADSLEWLVARWAIPSIGAVLVPINTRFRDTEIRFVLTHSDTETLIMGGGGRNVSYVDILRQIDAGMDGHEQGNWQSAPLPGLQRVIGLSDGALPPSMATFESIEENGGRLLRGAESVAQLQDCMHRVRSSDVAQILYTSGTTSFPKGAQVRHGALLQNNFQTLKRMHLSDQDKYLSCVPLFSATGTSYTLAMLLAGATMVILDKFDPRLFCETVEKERITAGFFVDTIIQDLKEFPDRASYDLSSLRTGTGAPLSSEAFMFATRELGIPQLIGVYGLSETSNAVARGDCGDPLEKRRSTNGRPVDGVEMRIADVDSNATLETGKTGEICIRGHVVMKGYYKQPDEDRKAFDLAGWFHTGDLGEFDPDGYLIYRGRVKEMIKPGGFNVATLEIEHFLKTYDGVRQAIVVGVPDPRLGEVAYAYIQPVPGTHIDMEGLRTYCRDHIAGYKAPRYFELVEDWPMTASQKIRKLELKKRAAQSIQNRLPLGPDKNDVVLCKTGTA
jgi:fatty-acyl-CoA synthase